MKEQTHSLTSFSAYLNKCFDLRGHAATMKDARQNPVITASSVFLALFHGFVFRLPSFQQLEKELAGSYLRQWIGAKRRFGDDTLRYSLCGFDLEPLERMLVDINVRLKRGKAFDQDRVQGRLVAALDGIEVLSSFSRCCDNCLERRVTLKENGVKTEHIQYYHRAVGCQMVHSSLRTFLGIEWQRPGEGEVAAALRLLTRMRSLYGCRFFDILLLDALYAQTPVLKLIRKIGWDAVISLKQNCPGLYGSAIRLFARRSPDTILTETLGHKTYEIQIWDTDGLPFTEDYPELVRVTRSEEILKRKRFRNRQKVSHSTDHEWCWITTLSTEVFSAATVRKLGKYRWRNENNGWMDLTKHWSFKHGFLHACKHRPKKLTATGELALVPNQGLPAVALIALIAFSLCAAFSIRHSKLARRRHLSGVAIAAQLRAGTNRLPSPCCRSDRPSP